MLLENKRLVLILSVIAVLLLLPLIAMQFTQEVNWTGSDFAIAAFLLVTTGLTCEVVLRKVKSFRSRLLICGAVLFVLALIWIELAVGIFGSPFAGS